MTPELTWTPDELAEMVAEDLACEATEEDRQARAVAMGYCPECGAHLDVDADIETGATWTCCNYCGWGDDL